MNSTVRLALAAVVTMLVLAGCAPRYKTTYDFVVPTNQDVSGCVEHCKEIERRCDTLCQNNQKICLKKAAEQAGQSYDGHLNRRKVQGKRLDLDENSFYDPMQCAKVSCDCKADYRVCYQMCGGVVKVKQECIENCQ